MAEAAFPPPSMAPTALGSSQPTNSVWIAACGLVLAILALIQPGGSATDSNYHRLSTLPPIILWAWERPEDMRFIDPNKIGVAFLAETIRLQGSEVYVRPRLQLLRVPTGTPLVAVVRLEIDRSKPPVLTAEQRARTVRAITEVSALPGVGTLQVDFDATESERTFYRALLQELRQALPQTTTLSITALASWCAYDDWLLSVPVDEAVPMLFRMGPEGAEVRRALQSRRALRAPVCRQSVGISTDEPLPRLPAHRRVYIFNAGLWSREALARVLAEVGEMQ